jgi:predicted pyridoxine 5'-phosphate oxidase superfamily flavin-nucleotide-binding protein
VYHHGSRSLQDRFDTRRLADRLEDVKGADRLDDSDRAFVEARDMFFLATADAEGRPTCSYKGGDPGFVRVLDERAIAWPSYDGNGMFLSLGNAAVNPWVGLLFIDFESPRRLRLEGRVSVDPDDPLAASWTGAQLAVRCAVERVYPNCPRYIHRMALVERSTFVPRGDAPPPVPGWKRTDWASDVLPAGDPAHEPPEAQRPR